METKVLDRSRLLTLLNYNPETGLFTWIVNRTRRGGMTAIGEVAGYKKSGDIGTGGGYWIVGIDGKPYRAHRLAWFYMTGCWPRADLDHKNGIRHDNRWNNLREATRTQNLQGTRLRKNSTSGLKGVSFDKERNLWKAQICVNKKHTMIGRFKTAAEAAEAYRVRAQEHFGQFARVA